MGGVFVAGPLVVVAELNGQQVFLWMQNQGQVKLRLACLEGCDDNNQRYFPSPRFVEEGNGRRGIQTLCRYSPCPG